MLNILKKLHRLWFLPTSLSREGFKLSEIECTSLIGDDGLIKQKHGRRRSRKFELEETYHPRCISFTFADHFLFGGRPRR